MESKPIHAVTGAFGYTGKYIAARLLAEGRTVATLTNSAPPENAFGPRMRVFPLRFDAPEQLAQSLRGVSVLYNTYWVRFSHPNHTLADATRNSRILFAAARAAGVERVVHISVTHPAEDSPLEYYREKARTERALRESGLSHAILRPAVLFGGDDMLVNNIAWALRRLLVFGIFGDGRYQLQPIHVDDLAALAVQQGGDRQDRVIDAIGPETFTYRELVETIGTAIGHPRPILSMPPAIGFAASRLMGKWVGDVLITRDEIAALMSNLLLTASPPAGTTRLTDWVRRQAATLGRHYRAGTKRARAK
jgi:NADH dehydrogenase